MTCYATESARPLSSGDCRTSRLASQKNKYPPFTRKEVYGAAAGLGCRGEVLYATPSRAHHPEPKKFEWSPTDGRTAASACENKALQGT